jgi:hypothetical protein
MELNFPIEFLVLGTPVSHQAARADSKDEWKARVKEASNTAITHPHFASEGRISVTLYYFPDEPMEGDVDNIVKLVLDALSKHVYVDDYQVERVVVQKFEPGNVFQFADPSITVLHAISGAKPVLYIRVSDDPFEDLQ